MTLCASFFCALAFAAEPAKEKEIKPVMVEACASSTSTITNESTGESVSVTCKKCADSLELATAEALVCSSSGVKKLIPLIS